VGHGRGNSFHVIPGPAASDLSKRKAGTWNSASCLASAWIPGSRAALAPGMTPSDGAPFYFGRADIATSMVTTSFVRLITSRTSLGAMKQLSCGLSTISLPPAITVSSPARMK
jgi:hypothetical protein